MKKASWLIKPLLPFMLASCATLAPNQGQGNELAAEFNRQAVADTYSIDCTIRDYVRSSNIERPDRRTPDAFRNSKDPRNTTLYSPNLTPEQRLSAERLINGLPDYVSDLMYKQGVVVVFTANSLVEALPQNAGTRDSEGGYPYHNKYAGLYNGEDKRIFVTFNIAKLEEKNGRTVITGYVPLFGSKERILLHEVGHFIDDLLGELGTKNSHTRFTDTASYLAALRADFEALAANPPSEAQLSRLDYFLPKEFKDVALFGEKGGWRDTRKEVFAELWSEVQGHNPSGLAKHFPKTFKLVQELDRELREIHSQNARQCAANQNAPAQQAVSGPRR